MTARCIQCAAPCTLREIYCAKCWASMITRKP